MEPGGEAEERVCVEVDLDLHRLGCFVVCCLPRCQRE